MAMWRMDCPEKRDTCIGCKYDELHGCTAPHKRQKRIKVYRICVLIIVAAALSLAINWLVVSLWNWLVPAIFHGPELSFWQMYGLTVLLNLILNIFRRRRA